MGAKSSRNTTQNNRSDGHLLGYFRKSFVRGGGGSNSAAGLSASGGNVADGLSPGNGYRYHTFTSPGTFIINNASITTFEILMVGGGGAGGKSIAGGGGAGGVLHGSISLSDGTYQVSVGKGGWGGPHSNAGLGGSPTDFYLNGVSFPNPSSFARAYGGGGGNGYATNNRTPNNPSAGAPSPWMGGGSAGGSSGGAGNQYGTGGYPGYTSATISKATPSPSVYVDTGYPASPITPAPYTPHPANPLPASPTAYGSDAPVPPAPTAGVHPTYYDQGLFPTTYYMGLRGWGNDGGMCFGPALDQGGAGGGGAGGAGQSVGSAPNSSGGSNVRGADGGIGKTFAGFTAPLFCDPSTPTGSTVKSTLDPLGGYFAGGGGGSNYAAAQGGAYGGGRGGDGGGGAGAPNGAPGTTFPPSTFNHPPLGYDSPSTNGTDAVLYSGGGGGGAGYSYGDPGSGGPGIVIIRYLI